MERLGRQDHLAAAGLIGGHALHHAYGHAFYVLLPAIYTSLGLTPFTAGLIGSIRSMGFGLSSTVGGVLIDRIQHRRLLILYLSMATLGLGYLMVGLAPNYLLILTAILVTSAAGSIWHPASRSLLSQIYSHRRGLVISIDRSAGDVGDTVGPLLAGALLLAFAWQEIYVAAFPIALLALLMLWRLLRRAGSFQELGAGMAAAPRPLGRQMRELWELLRGSGKVLLLLIAVKSIAGFGQGGLILFIPLYLQETLGMESLGIGFHVALLTAVGIATNPVFGMLSDRIGRPPVVLLVLTAKAAVATMLALMGEGIALTVLLAVMGAFLHAVDPVIQAWGLDVAHGRKLEGTVLGTLYGGNFLLRGIAPLILGGIIGAYGFSALFWYVAAMNIAAMVLVAASLPFLLRDSRAVAR
jgi:MFS transporter, FSR family, fosmidomycin resistance protein